MIDITRGNDWALRIALSQDGEPFPVLTRNGLGVNLVTNYGRKTQLTPTVRSGLVYADVNGYALPCGTYGVEVLKTGDDGNWRTFGSAMVRITNETTEGDNQAAVGGDDYDVIMEATGIVVNLSMAVDGQAGGGGGGVTPEEFIALEERVYALEEGKQDVIADLGDIRSGATLGSTALQEESDPNVPEWAKAKNKPSYTANEVGALPEDTPIPSSLSELEQDDKFMTVESAEKEEWNGKENRMIISRTLHQVLIKNTYYALSTALTGTVSVTLPFIEDTNVITTISLNFATAANFTELNITPPTGVAISFYDGYRLEPEKEYELNLLFNGVKWIVSYAVIG